MWYISIVYLMILCLVHWDTKSWSMFFYCNIFWGLSYLLHSDSGTSEASGMLPSLKWLSPQEVHPDILHVHCMMIIRFHAIILYIRDRRTNPPPPITYCRVWQKQTVSLSVYVIRSGLSGWKKVQKLSWKNMPPGCWHAVAPKNHSITINVNPHNHYYHTQAG